MLPGAAWRCVVLRGAAWCCVMLRDAAWCCVVLRVWCTWGGWWRVRSPCSGRSGPRVPSLSPGDGGWSTSALLAGEEEGGGRREERRREGEKERRREGEQNGKENTLSMSLRM